MTSYRRHTARRKIATAAVLSADTTMADRPLPGMRSIDPVVHNYPRKWPNVRLLKTAECSFLFRLVQKSVKIAQETRVVIENNVARFLWLTVYMSLCGMLLTKVVCCSGKKNNSSDVGESESISQTGGVRSILTRAANAVRSKLLAACGFVLHGIQINYDSLSSFLVFYMQSVRLRIWYT